MSDNQFHDYYEILEVNPDASHHEIVKAYHRAKETYDTDSAALYTMFTKEEAAELRNLVEEAYQVLSNHTKRKEYDENFRGTGSTESLADEIKSEAKKDNREHREEKPKETLSVPDGYKKSAFGVYEVNPDIETVIESETNFDGGFLKSVREYQKISLEQISKETRISRSYINAVETNDYESLPAPVFVRGFIIQLCKILNLDGNKVAASYMEKFNKSE